MVRCSISGASVLPFVVGFYVPEEYFCNRSKETELPEDCILKARTLSFVR